MKPEKLTFARKILNLESEEVLNEISDTIKRFVVTLPCQHTKKEMLKSGYDAIKAYEAGELIPHESIKRKFVG